MLAEASCLASGDILLRSKSRERERGCVAELARPGEQIEPGAIRQSDIADQQVGSAAFRSDGKRAPKLTSETQSDCQQPGGSKRDRKPCPM